MILNNGNISVCIDEKTGITTRISNPDDKYEMNWIMEKSDWGTTEGFEVKWIKAQREKAEIFCVREKLCLVIEKKITENGYYETYSLTNTGDFEFFLTKENFGIHFPYQCHYSIDKDILNQTCISHIWCGGDITWLYSVKPNGKPPYLVMNMTEGIAEDYSISYDISRTEVGAHYRGSFVLHTAEQVIMPGETVKCGFCYRFSNSKPDCDSYFTADKYTLNKGEMLNFELKTAEPCSEVSVYCEDKELPCVKNGNIVSGSCSFEETGEKKIIAEFDGRKTQMFVNVIPKLSDILDKRAHFIAEKQQYRREGSHLDGAYLIYDNETKSLYCDSTKLYDHNAARERIGMGVLVCKALREKYDEKLMESLKKHREFVEREIFDEDTGMVFNNVCREKGSERIFNFPWLSVYFLEWYELTGEKKCIENAANILLKFFEIAQYKYPAQCIEAVRICNALEKEGMNDLKNTLRDTFLLYVNNSSELLCADMECTWCSEAPSNHLCYQSQAYLLTNDDKYLKMAENSLLMLKAFFAKQPDFHLNCVPVRYWDRYWFGKYPSYGDVFPHYWSALAGWAMAWYDKACGKDLHREEINANLYGNLCIFREDGFAANNYLYPYKITLYSSDENYENEYIKPGITYGKNYDQWANDQDWALYYAAMFVK